jgi:hypothetical protein
MKTTHLIALTATIVACTAATASARPAVEPPGSQASKPSAVTSGSNAAHRWNNSSEMRRDSQAQPAPAPLTDRTATDDGFPLVFVLIGLTVPLSLVLMQLVGKPALAYSRHRRRPTTVA